MKITKKNIKLYCKDFYRDSDGYWAILKNNYCYGVDSNKVATADTLNDLIEMLNNNFRFTLNRG